MTDAKNVQLNNAFRCRQYVSLLKVCPLLHNLFAVLEGQVGQPLVTGDSPIREQANRDLTIGSGDIDDVNMSRVNEIRAHSHIEGFFVVSHGVNFLLSIRLSSGPGIDAR
jgi:hypothetical protein